MNEPTLHFDQLSPEAQARIFAAKGVMEQQELQAANRFADSPTFVIPRGAEEASIRAPREVDERFKELEAKLEKRATSQPVDRVDESLEKSSPKTLAELLTTEKRMREFAKALMADQLDEQQQEFYQAVKERFGEVIGNLTKEPPLSFEEYQASAKKTAIYNRDARVLYPALGLAGEVGELGEKVLQMAVHAGKCANQVKKIIRDDDCECDTPRKHDIGKEIGGVLWYCAAVASDLGFSLGDIAQENLDVLASRQERGTIQGDGDNR